MGRGELRRLLLAAGMILGLGGGSAYAGSETVGGPAALTMEPLLAGGTVVYRVGEELYSIKRGGGKPLPVSPRIQEPGVTLLSPQLAEMEDQVAAAWLEKRPEGNRLFALYALAGGTFPAEPRLLAENTATTAVALEPLAGGLLVLDAARKPHPSLFVARLGQAPAVREPLPLGDLEILHSISTTSTGSVLHVFLHGRSQGQDFIGLLDYDAETRKAGALERVAEIPMTPLVQAFSVKGIPGVVFKVYDEGRFSLRLALREDKGWRISAVTGADGLDVARVDCHAWPDGRILLVFSGEQRGKAKQRVYAALSDDLGASWRTRQLDGAEFGNTRAWLPRMAVADQGVAVVWEDARDIRSRIRMQLSMDRGDTWLGHDLPVSPAQRYALRPRIEAGQGSLRIAWQQFRSDSRDLADVVLRSMTWDEARALAARAEPGKPSAEAQRQRLSAAVNAYWKAMEKNDTRATYQAQDPFYRAKVTLAGHGSHSGALQYRKHKLEDLVIRGSEATAIVNVSVAPGKGTGKAIPASDFIIRDTWLLIDGHWYRKFVDNLSGGSAINY